MKVSSSQSIKLENSRLLMSKIIQLKSFTRIELSRLTTLTKATVSSIVNDFVESKLIVETDETISTGGRRANVLRLNKNAGRIISIELLPKQVYGIITNLYGETLYSSRLDVSNNDFKNYLKVLLKSIDILKENTYESVYGIIGIGISVYGIVSSDQIVKFATFNQWKDIDLKKIIEDYTGIETYVENESNMSALSEIINYHDRENIVSLHIGTGVGMGIVINGQIYKGEDGFAGEIGHTIVVPDGRACVCGNYGCLETYLSDNGVIRSYKDITNSNITISEFIDSYQNKDAHSIDVYDQFTSVLAIAINNISQTLNPHTIIVQSKIVDEIPETLSDVRNKLRSKIINITSLTSRKFNDRNNVFGLSHLLISKFLDADTYKINIMKADTKIV